MTDCFFYNWTHLGLWIYLVLTRPMFRRGRCRCSGPGWRRRFGNGTRIFHATSPNTILIRLVKVWVDHFQSLHPSLAIVLPTPKRDRITLPNIQIYGQIPVPRPDSSSPTNPTIALFGFAEWFFVFDSAYRTRTCPWPTGWRTPRGQCCVGPRCRSRTTWCPRHAPPWSNQSRRDLWWWKGFPWRCTPRGCSPMVRSRMGTRPSDSHAQTPRSPDQREGSSRRGTRGGIWPKPKILVGWIPIWKHNFVSKYARMLCVPWPCPAPSWIVDIFSSSWARGPSSHPRRCGSWLVAVWTAACQICNA